MDGTTKGEGEEPQEQNKLILKTMSALANNKRKAAFIDGAINHPSNNVDYGENGHAQISRSVFTKTGIRNAQARLRKSPLTNPSASPPPPLSPRTGLNNELLYLFDKAVRNITFTEVEDLVRSILDAAKTKEDVEDMFLLAFQTRWSRGGKGEKLIFYQMMNVLLKRLPLTTLSVLDLVPHFGYWKDGLLLLKECIATNKIASDEDIAKLKEAVYKGFAEQLKKDLAEVAKAREEKRTPNLSFAAKYAPSEKKEFDKLLGCTEPIARLMYPDIKAKGALIKEYRKALAVMRDSLDVPEVKECANKWAEIDFNRVTSLALNRKMKAYLNELQKDSKMGTGDYDETGDRFPDKEDRVTARKHLIDLIVKKSTVKGKDLMPHELVENVRGRRSSKAEGLVVNAQWKTLRESVVAMAEERRAELEKKEMEKYGWEGVEGGKGGGGKGRMDLEKIICMADVSGSMSGTPMSVSIAMGILLSEICHEKFRDLVLTFDDHPVFHDLTRCADFSDKVASLARAPWGGSTNFEGAMKLIADVVRREKLKQEEVPDLMVVSDMQFNEAHNGYYSGSRDSPWSTASENIKEMFKKLGEEIHGEPLEAPKIIFWNVRTGSTGLPATADEEGVVCLSGYSASLMKFVLSGEMEDEEKEEIVVDKETGEVTVVKTKVKVTPAMQLRRVLDDEGLLPVKERIASQGKLDEEWALYEGARETSGGEAKCF